MEEVWKKLEVSVMEVMDESLAREEMEFAMERALYLIEELKKSVREGGKE